MFAPGVVRWLISACLLPYLSSFTNYSLGRMGYLQFNFYHLQTGAPHFMRFSLVNCHQPG
jgi:hypothetical protein